MLDAFGGDIGNDADNDQRNERHDRDRWTDLSHQVNRIGDDGKPDKNIIDKDDEERQLLYISLKAADGFTCRVGQL